MMTTTAVVASMALLWAGSSFAAKPSPPPPTGPIPEMAATLLDANGKVVGYPAEGQGDSLRMVFTSQNVNYITHWKFGHTFYPGVLRQTVEVAGDPAESMIVWSGLDCTGTPYGTVLAGYPDAWSKAIAGAVTLVGPPGVTIYRGEISNLNQEVLYPQSSSRVGDFSNSCINAQWNFTTGVLVPLTSSGIDLRQLFTPPFKFK